MIRIIIIFHYTAVCSQFPAKMDQKVVDLIGYSASVGVPCQQVLELETGIGGNQSAEILRYD